MRSHFSQRSAAFWGKLVEVDGWRIVVQPRGAYALQAADGADCWETVGAFPTAGWLCAHLHGVYDVPPALSAVADRFPELPPKGRAERLALLRDIAGMMVP